MKQLKVKKATDKIMPKLSMANKPLKMKTNVKAGGFDWESLWSWVPGLGDGEEKK